ncbi:MAG TPA: alpha/beta hydrolase [Flavobacterium sp.]|jgi:pimeloyl-ACP methyl ester carboxylesterase
MNSDKFFPLQEIAIKRILNGTDNPTLIFLHDSLGSIDLWRDFPQRLGELTNCNILVYDRQGYGKSRGFLYSKRDVHYMEQEADILNELIDFWGLDKVILFGHSDGGSISLIAAAKYPGRILGVITEGAHVFVEDVTIHGINEVIQLYKSTDLKAKLSRYHSDKTDEMFWAWADTWTREDFRHWNIEHFLPSVKCPTLIIQGEDDEYGTLNQVQRIASQAGGQALKLIIPNTKHTPHKESPDLILEKSSCFIRELAGII